MVAEGMNPVDGVLQRPAGAVRLALRHVVIGVLGLAAQVISRNVAAAVGMVVQPAGAGAEGEALDGDELQIDESAPRPKPAFRAVP